MPCVHGAEQQRRSNASAVVVLAAMSNIECLSCAMSIETAPLSIANSLYHLFLSFLKGAMLRKIHSSIFGAMHGSAGASPVYTTSHTHRHTITPMASYHSYWPRVHVFGLQEEAREPRENTCFFARLNPNVHPCKNCALKRNKVSRL